MRKFGIRPVKGNVFKKPYYLSNW